MITALLFALLASFPVTIRVDADRPTGELTPIWRFVGGDEPNYAQMKDGRKLLGALLDRIFDTYSSAACGPMSRSAPPTRPASATAS